MSVSKRLPPRLSVAGRCRRLACERGQATVEFALILPALLLLILGMLDFGRAVNYYNTLTELAAEGARSAAVNLNPDGTTVNGLSIQNQIKCQAVSRRVDGEPDLPRLDPQSEQPELDRRGSAGAGQSVLHLQFPVLSKDPDRPHDAEPRGLSDDAGRAGRDVHAR